MSIATIGRRSFLEGSIAAVATLPSALALTPPEASLLEQPISEELANESPVLHPPEVLAQRDTFFAPYASFRELQLGSVIPEGWLKQELEKQISGMTRPQTDFCFPFDRRYWASNERGQDEESRNGGTFWYPWEQTGYWIDGQPEEDWTPIAMPEFEITSPGYFLMWGAAAKSPRNYALSLNESAAIERPVRFRASAPGEHIWKDPPVALEVPVRRIPGWDLIRPGGHLPKWYMTPSLPENLSPTGPVEHISLVPLGSTHLRLTVFPVCKDCV